METDILSMWGIIVYKCILYEHVVADGQQLRLGELADPEICVLIRMRTFIPHV